MVTTRNNDPLGNKDLPQDASHSSASPGVRTDECDESIITNIRITDAALGLRRIPAGFFVVVDHNGLEWRTENKCISVDNDIIEWDEQIPMPSELSTTVGFRIYASFELQPMLGGGEELRELTITVRQLLEYDEKALTFTLFPMDGDVASPCSSLLVAIGRGTHTYGERMASRIDDHHPHSLSTESEDELIRATNDGHVALLRYQKHGEQRDIERSIEQFEYALCLCPPDHPCHAAAQSNLATSKFVYCQVHDAGFSFDVPISLYRDALNARPAGHLDRPRTLIQLATVHFAQFKKERQAYDAAQAKTLLHEAINLSPSQSHERRAAVFMLHLHTKHRMDDGLPPQHDLGSGVLDMDPFELGTHLLSRFERFGDIEDVHQAIFSLERSVQSSSRWDEQYLPSLANLGVAFFHRYNRLGVLSDLENAIIRFRNVTELSPNHHYHKPSHLSCFGAALQTRFNRLGEVSDLHDGISMLRNAVELTPDQHPDKPACLNNLGGALVIRFHRLREVNDLQDAISMLRDAVELTPNQHPHKPVRLSNLGNALGTCFDRLGEVSDLQDAISRLRDAVELTPNQHPDKPGRLSNLGNALKTRFHRLGEVNDLQDAISILKDAVELMPNQHPDKPGRLNNLGIALGICFDYLGKVSDLQDAISRLRDAVKLTPNQHPEKPGRLSNLGTALRTRFDRLGEVGDLQDAISRLRDAVELTPNQHPYKPTCLNNLGTTLVIRFHRLGGVDDLQDAILRISDAVELTPSQHPDKPGRLNSLGSALKTRFDCLGEVSDLKDAISMLRDAVELMPDQHSDKPGCLNNLGNALRTRFDRLGDIGDLQDAISRLRGAAEFMPNQHSDKPTCLNNLGNTLATRFNRLGEISDLQDAISRFRDAVELTPNQHAHKPGYLSNLGNSLVIRFDHLGEVSDLQDAISRLRNAVELMPDQHSEKRTCLNCLGTALRTRFHRLGEVSDLQDAISMLRDAVELTPNQHPHKPACLNNLGTTVQTRFDRLGEVSDLQDAISMLRDAVELTPDQHPYKPTCLNNLGNALRTRFYRLGEVNDLQDAVSMLRDAVELTPNQHLNKPRHLSNLGNALRNRFHRLREVSDLQDAISRLRGAAELTPNQHPGKPGYLNNLGNALQTRFDHLGEVGDIEEAISLYSSSALASTGPAAIRLEACYYWAMCARLLSHHSLINAHAVAISILPQLAWAGLSLTDRYRELIKGTGIVREAAAAALDSGLPDIAVEWLEQGRSIVWGDLYQLRNSYDELLGAHPDHAHSLQQLSAKLEHASVTREKSISLLSEKMQHAEDAESDSLQKLADRHRDLAIERDKLLHEIRRFPGFERFLLQKEFSRLRASAHTGPVVILNAAEKRCDALIILADMEEPIQVPLQNFSPKRSTDIQNSLKRLVVRARVPCDESERKAKLKGGNSDSWDTILSDLWKNVVKPVFDALAISTPGDLSRIFWCPTGPFTFLPIHAAGLYGTQYSEPGHKLSDFAVSSYIPTLSILGPSPEPANATTHENICILAIPQPESDGQMRLPGVNIELQHIRAVIDDGESGRISLVESRTGMVEEVLSLMEQSDWVHFACHGVQDFQNPTTSGLCLANGRRLKVSDIVSLSRPRGGLAFLSACQTAMGDEKLSDEAIHIAAGMLFAGYGGVVGSMWSISDRLAPEVARDVYKQLCRDGAVPDHRNAARALHDAVVRLRDEGESFSGWLPFIHVGL